MREAQKLIVIAPYYNEEQILDEKVKRLDDILKILINKSKIKKDSFILYIDDRNEDITRNIIEYLGIKNLFIKSVGFFKNKGYCNVLFDKLPKSPRLIVDITSPLKSMLNV
jgi:glycosyltransferases involved in cell wall biogenesis